MPRTMKKRGSQTNVKTVLIFNKKQEKVKVAYSQILQGKIRDRDKGEMCVNREVSRRCLTQLAEVQREVSDSYVTYVRVVHK
jgi:hypothetical protein